MKVIDYEIQYLTAMAKKLEGDDKEFIQSKVDCIEFGKSTIETNIQTKIITAEQYIKGIKAYKMKTDQLLAKATNELGANSETVARLKKRA